MTETTVKERPILFSSEMVRAILDGRKTQTRRIVKPQPEFGINPCHYSKTGWAETDESLKGCLCWKTVKCPYGFPGERIWVRETWAASNSYDSYNGALSVHVHNVAYKAGGGFQFEFGERGKWRPSIHMPRWASRITLEVTDVRGQRLQDISEEDAIAEGCEREFTPDGSDYGCGLTTAVENFALLWNSINGDGSWETNPWVWCLTFNKLENEQ